MFHVRDGFTLTPYYDQVASSLYPEYQSIALEIAGKDNFNIKDLLPKHIIQLAQEFELNEKVIINATETISKRLNQAQTLITNSFVGNKKLKNNLTEIMEKRWNGTFASIGQLLSKRQSKGVKN